MITPRLQKIIDAVDAERIADIGTDHAYIPIRLAQEGRIKWAAACDKNIGPLQKAKENAEKYGFADIIELRLGDGLSPIEAGEAEQVIIAGMGGNLIADIVEAEIEKSKSFRFLLQPMNAQYELRKCLIENGFTVCGEELSCEGFKVYNHFSCIAGKSRMPEEIHLHIPEELRGHVHYEKLLQKKKREFEKIISGQKNSASPDYKVIEYYEKLNYDLRNIL